MTASSPRRAVLHAVKSGAPDTAQRLYGTFPPLLSSTPPEHHAKIAAAVRALLARQREFAQTDRSNPSISEPTPRA